MAFSAHDAAIDFTLPPAEYADAWQVIVDTLHSSADQPDAVVKPGGTVSVGPRALVVLQALREND